MIIREIAQSDRAEYLEMSADFYSSPAVLSDIPAAYRERAFEEYLRGTHAKCFIFEEGGKVAGYGIICFMLFLTKKNQFPYKNSQFLLII